MQSNSKKEEPSHKSQIELSILHTPKIIGTSLASKIIATLQHRQANTALKIKTKLKLSNLSPSILHSRSTRLLAKLKLNREIAEIYHFSLIKLKKQIEIICMSSALQKLVNTISKVCSTQNKNIIKSMKN
jgi:hypothetical protein